MMKASRWFTEDQKQSVQAAVLSAEQATSGEIIPVVATRSGCYERGEDIFGLLFSIGLLSACWFAYPLLIPGNENWGEIWTGQLPLFVIIAILLTGFLIGTKLAVMFPSLAVLLISKQQMQQAVERKAIEAFHHFKLSDTRDGTGVLIYISLYEHMVTVLGDSGISEKIDPQAWHEICSNTVNDIKQGKPADAMINAITCCGDILATHFPIQPDDTNELGNELQLID